MSLENVKNEILEEAQEKSAEIEKEAEKERQKILKEADEKINEIQEQKEKELEDRKEEIEKQELSEARMKAKNKKLKEKQKKTEETFKQFQENISKEITENEGQFLEKCLEKAPFEVSKIKGSEEFSEEVTQRGFEFEEIEETGLVLISEDESRRISFTTEDILKEFKTHYRKEVSKKLF